MPHAAPQPAPPRRPDGAIAQDEAALVSEFRRYRLLAGGALVAAAAAWGLSHAVDLPGTTEHLLRAVAEAGMVGGLADWFAVTALFRRPLGLPIPHTALVPRNRDRIADGIANYIDREFLEPGMLVEQLRRIDLAARLGRILADPSTGARLTDLILSLLPGMLGGDGDEAAIRSTLARALREALAGIDPRRPLAAILRAVVEGDAMEGLITELSNRLVMMVQDRRPWLEEAVERRSKWWIPASVDKKLAGNMADAAIDHLFDLRSPMSEPGMQLRVWLRGLPDDVENGGPLGTRLTAAIGALLKDGNVAELVDRALDTLRRLAADDLAAGPDGRIRQVVEAAIGSLAGQLSDPALRDRINHSLEEGFRAAIPRWRKQIRRFVSATLRGQELEQFTNRLETRVGKDLQFIRINGTVLGAVIGGLLYGLNSLLG